MLIVILAGTGGFMWVEGWDFWKSLFFTLITITTVGYGDYGLSDAGERFTAILLIGGIVVATYALGQVVQVLVDYRFAWERKMNRQIHRLSDHFIICGLGRIGRAVCIKLARENVPFVGIDTDERAVEDMIEHGHLARVGDATDDSVLEECGIQRARGIACVAGSDTENIVITFSARAMNPDLLIVSRAEHEDSVRKIRRAGASRIISPIRTGGLSIAKAILNPCVADFIEEADDVEGGISLSEMIVKADSPLDGTTVREYVARHGSVVLIALKRRDGALRIRPGADETLGAGDVLIVAGDAGAVSAAAGEAEPRSAAA
jgi:voltage-gated potassium channel